MTAASTYILDSAREYSIYVAQTRAIPKAADGLKNGQRIALWLLRNRADKLKTIALSGQMSFERLYVHGDASANNTINLLAAPYRNNIPLIEGLGQFGNRLAPVDGIGAPRYTEVRRSKAAEAILYRDLDLVPLTDNYDGSNKEPVHFLPLIPLVLLNGIEGVAVGWSTSILPRKLSTLVEATKAALTGKPIKDLTPHFDRYDVKVASTGPNQWTFTGRAVIVDTSTVQITELPPGLSIEAFRKTLIQMEEAEQIRTFTDRSSETIDITVKMPRGSVAQWSESDAIDFFKLREKATERIVVVDWNNTSIRQYESAADLVKDFAAWRLGWYKVRYEKRLADTTYELAYWRAIKALFDSGFTKKLGTFPDKAGMVAEVGAIASKAKVGVDADQIEKIVGLPTYRWTKDFEKEVIAKIAALEGDIADYTAILASPDRQRDIFVSELDTLKKEMKA